MGFTQCPLAAPLPSMLALSLLRHAEIFQASTSALGL